jgi:hypothetical protein
MRLAMGAALAATPGLRMRQRRRRRRHRRRRAAPADLHRNPGPATSEVTNFCVSWRLDNAEPIQVNRVSMTTGRGWHHSNWFYVQPGFLPVEDGLWDCSRTFDQASAGLSGGALFAQSTQATEEVQDLGPGIALDLPAGAVVVGQIHVINAGEDELETGIELTIDGIPEEEVVVRLRPLAFDLHQLAIPPLRESRFVAECDMATAWGGPLDLSLYYVLPHYHELGLGLSVEALGGDRDGESIYATVSRSGSRSASACRRRFRSGAPMGSASRAIFGTRPSPRCASATGEAPRCASSWPSPTRPRPSPAASCAESRPWSASRTASRSIAATARCPRFRADDTALPQAHDAPAALPLLHLEHAHAAGGLVEPLEAVPGSLTVRELTASDLVHPLPEACLAVVHRPAEVAHHALIARIGGEALGQAIVGSLLHGDRDLGQDRLRRATGTGGAGRLQLRTRFVCRRRLRYL